jgi:membrane-bound lytic murein transglycosylase A
VIEPSQKEEKSTLTVPPHFKLSTFSDLPGWEKDAVKEVWPAFLKSCRVLSRRLEWAQSCAAANMVNEKEDIAVRDFFEYFFLPYRVLNPDASSEGLVTGYYEPLLRGLRKQAGKYQIPLYRAPEDMLTVDLSSVYPELKTMRLRGRLVGNKVVPYLSRAELTQSSSLVGREIVWVENAVDASFLQIQGSGRVYLVEEGKTIRLAYADQNGHPYRSIGKYLIDRGELKSEQASAQGIRNWIMQNPARAEEVLNANPSYVFFREEQIIDPEEGPKGSLGVPLTPERSIAIDAQFITLGVPVFLSTTYPNSGRALQRLMMAQDTGGAIRNAVRADFFWGLGDAAGELAGRMKQRGAMWVLLPKLLVTTSLVK